MGVAFHSDVTIVHPKNPMTLNSCYFPKPSPEGLDTLHRHLSKTTASWMSKTSNKAFMHTWFVGHRLGRFVDVIISYKFTLCPIMSSFRFHDKTSTRMTQTTSNTTSSFSIFSVFLLINFDFKPILPWVPLINSLISSNPSWAPSKSGHLITCTLPPDAASWADKGSQWTANDRQVSPKSNHELNM